MDQSLRIDLLDRSHLVRADFASPRALADDVVTDDYFAAMLGVGKSATATMRRTGRGPAWYRLNGRPYYRIEDIRQWIESNRVEASA